ncbi:MAG: TIGR02391 family protein [Sulfurimonas sp.]|nr:TIGR02391 family protein [Sulfurimonas sp.]
MAHIQPFNAQNLEAICKVLADTDNGLTGTQIGYILQDCKVKDTDPSATKWKRLFNAMANTQNECNIGNFLIMFINRAMNPVNYAREKEKFEWRKTELNIVLSFSGFEVREDGKVIGSKKETTLKGARKRAGALRSKLEDRNAHIEIYNFCKAELLAENYFHAVLEAIKGLAQRIRDMSGLTLDGAELFNTAFSVKNPILGINELNSETDKSEQKGFSNMLIGLFGAIRNPIAHVPKAYWSLSEQDALDILSTISFAHRKLDITKKC